MILIFQILFISVFTNFCNGQVKTNIKPEGNFETSTKSINSKKENSHSNIQNFGTFPLNSSGDLQISDVVRKIFQDSKGNLWFGTQNGAFRYDGISLTHIDSIKSQTGNGVTIKDIVEDIDGNIWFGHTGGVSMYNSESIKNYSEKDGLIDNDVWCIAADRNNKLWIGTIQGVCYFFGGTFTALVIPDGKPDLTKGVSSAKMIHSIMEDRQGKLWFGTNGGVYIYDGKLLTSISEKDGLQSNFVNDILEDKEGNFWISTAHRGLFYFNGDTLTKVTEGVLDDDADTGSIIEDKNGNIWFISNGRDLYRYNGKDFTKYRIAEGNFGPVTFQIYEDQQERLWFVGFSGAYRYENRKFVNITQNGPW